MFRGGTKVLRLLLCAGFVVAAVCLSLGGFSSAEGGWFSGQTYGFLISGTWGTWFSGEARVFGSDPQQVSGWFPGTESPSDYVFWDEEDVSGLPPGCVRLTFYVEDVSPMAGMSGVLADLHIFDFLLPSGAAYLPDTGRITFGFADGLNPVTYGPTWGPMGSGVFMESGSMRDYFEFQPPGSGWFDPINHPGQTATDATYEIVVDNVPEPLTISLFGLGALALVGAGRRSRPKRA